MAQLLKEPVYEYSPLAKDHIRLLNLLPSVDGNPDSPISGELLATPLFPSSVPFSALSYAWGHSLPGSSSINYLITPTGIIHLTPSLFSFLRRLRNTSDQPRLLWADAICINQAEPHEKEVQVALMADVYRSATRVLADLGEEAEDSHLALEAIDRYWRAGLKRGIDGRAFGRKLTAEESARFLNLPLETQDQVQEEEKQAPPEPEEVKVRQAFIAFYERPWFTRIWVVQEFVLAREVEIYCGITKLQWQPLFAAGIMFDGMPMLCHELIGSTMQEIQGLMSYVCMAYIKRVRELNSTEDGKAFVHHLGSLSDGRLMRFYINPGLSDLLHYLRGSRATLGKDRYFALLGLANDFGKESWGELRPDYISSDDQIMRRYARVLITNVPKQTAAEIFMRAGLWRGTNPELPSWFEDYTQHNSSLMDLTVEETMHKAAGDTEFNISIDLESPNVLGLKGYRIDCLEEVCAGYGPSDKATTPADKASEIAFDYIRQGAAMMLKLSTNADDPPRPGPYLTGEDLSHAAGLTLCAYRGIETLVRETMCRGFWFLCMAIYGLGTNWGNAGNVFPYTWSSEMEAQIASDIDYYAMELGTICVMGLIPAVSEKGYFASAPPKSAVGDEVWILKGCRLPILLRSNDEPEYGGQYRLVGACYVHGIMNGEALKYEDFAWREISIC
ncbi:heterokaryon incompatibility protein-domain-containing protein [Podospora fimiseda]|uniref:Heterokaryon incompatibility protein-domain-containing protein n=1 Tax=Podospora fimiseda TaxID=252190 RepID=A0AAN7BGC6_9PEZI|nr:heterokaryon incompatibility protein-domain-containing protein [Podospora fimiseda]